MVDSNVFMGHFIKYLKLSKKQRKLKNKLNEFEMPKKLSLSIDVKKTKLK